MEGNFKYLSEKDINQICGRYKDGKSINEISEEVGQSKELVINVLIKRELIKPTRINL